MVSIGDRDDAPVQPTGNMAALVDAECIGTMRTARGTGEATLVRASCGFCTSAGDQGQSLINQALSRDAGSTA